MSRRAIVAFALVIAAFAAWNGSAPMPVVADSHVVRIGLVEQPNSLDPLDATQFYENYLEEAIFGALVVIDDRGNPAPDLAERVPTRANGDISRDGKTLTYHLRRGVRWQDGATLTSADVAYTFERMMAPATNFPQTSTYEAISRVETPDPFTVVVRLKAPWPDATSQLFVNGQNGAIVPKHVLERVADLGRSAFESAPIGSGPYRVERWDRGSRVVLVANDTYFRGKPAIDRIEFDFIPAETTLGFRLQTGELDFSPQLPPPNAVQLRRLPRMRFASVPTYVALQLDFNVRASPFDDVRVRRAFALAVDRSLMIRTAYRGLAVAADDLVPPQSAFHSRDPSVREGADPKDAAALLDASGWRTGPDGFRHKHGVTLAAALAIPTGYPVVNVCAVELQAAWRALGIDASLRPLQTNLLYAPRGPLARGDFGVSLTTYGYSTSPDRSQNLTVAALPPNGFNYAHLSDAALDRRIHAARSEPDPGRRRALYASISAEVRHDAILIPILWQSQGYLYDARLRGMRPEPVNSDLWNVYDWRW